MTSSIMGSGYLHKSSIKDLTLTWQPPHDVSEEIYTIPMPKRPTVTSSALEGPPDFEDYDIEGDPVSFFRDVSKWTRNMQLVNEAPRRGAGRPRVFSPTTLKWFTAIKKTSDNIIKDWDREGREPHMRAFAERAALEVAGLRSMWQKLHDADTGAVTMVRVMHKATVEMNEFAIFGDYYHEILTHIMRDPHMVNLKCKKGKLWTVTWDHLRPELESWNEWGRNKNRRDAPPKPNTEYLDDFRDCWTRKLSADLQRAPKKEEINDYGNYMLFLIQHYAARNHAFHSGLTELARGSHWAELATKIASDKLTAKRMFGGRHREHVLRTLDNVQDMFYRYVSTKTPPGQTLPNRIVYKIIGDDGSSDAPEEQLDVRCIKTLENGIAYFFLQGFEGPIDFFL